MKKFLSNLICFIIIAAVFTVPVSAKFDSGYVTENLRSDIYYMENLDEGTVFFEKNSTKKTPAAGFIKLIAAIVALEKWQTLDGTVTLTEKNLNLFDYEYGMTTAIYKAGEKVTRQELFNCLVVYSANDALSVIASETVGSVDALIKEMQALVDKIGCTSTVIKNIHGFDQDGQYTTAQDVAKIIKYGLSYPAFAEAFSTDTVVLKETDLNEERTYYSSNHMLNPAVADYYHSSVTGGKQTYTDLAGECVAVTSSADGYSYLTIVMQGYLSDIDSDGYDENSSMTDAQLMLDWVYENIRYRVIVSPEQTVATVKVNSGKDVQELKLVPEKETSALVPSKASPATVMFKLTENIESITPPVEKGEVLGTADVYYAGQRLTTVNVVASEKVELSFSGLIITAIKKIVGSVPFAVLSFLAAVCGCLYFVWCLTDFICSKNEEKNKKWQEKKAKIEALFKKTKKSKKSKKKAPSKGKAKPNQKKLQAKPNQNQKGKTQAKPNQKSVPQAKLRPNPNKPKAKDKVSAKKH
ncbi:MAG: D-alanyl-D-alanine carboxypeptidase family protein [Acutalibacteraceae bacterium]